MQAPQGFGHIHYVPILKLMQGERDALAQLAPSLRTRVTPLFEVRPPKEKRSKGKTETTGRETMDEVLKTVGAKLAKAVVDGCAFIDTLHVSSERMVSGEHPLAHVLKAGRKAGVALVPVTGPERTAQHQAVVKKAVAEDGRGVCVRVLKRDLFNDDLDEVLSSVLAKVGVEPKSTDLLLDVGQVTSDEVNLLARGIIGILGSISGVTEFRTLTLSAGAFPESISHISGAEKIDRADWALWQSVVKKAKSVTRLPTFSDYSIQGVPPPTSEAFKHSPSANIRYTAGDHWLVVRGKSLGREDGYEQYAEMAQYLTQQDCYVGPDFSAGDKYIYECAHGVETSGNPAVWRRVGTSHHVAQVVNQVTKLRGT